MGEVIQLFRVEGPPPDKFVVEDVISDEMADSIVNTWAALNELWEADSEEDLMNRFRLIKDTVGRWPS